MVNIPSRTSLSINAFETELVFADENTLDPFSQYFPYMSPSFT